MKAGDKLTIRALVDTGKYQGKIVASMPYTVQANVEPLTGPVPEGAVSGAAG